MTKKRLPWACLLFIIALPLAAQTPRQAALFIAPLDAGLKDALLEDILSSELTAMVGNQGITVQPRRLSLPAGADQPALPAEQRLSRLLGGINSTGIDIIVAAFYYTEGDQLTIQFALYDPAVRVVLGGVLTRARKGLTVFASAGSAVADFQPAVKRYVDGGYDVAPPTGMVERIVVSGPQEGCRIVMVDKDFGVISGGKLVIAYSQFRIGTAVPVQVIKEGYHTFQKTVMFTTAEAALELPRLQPETRFDASLTWTLGQALGVGFGGRIHLVPDALFVGVEQYRTLELTSSSFATVRHYDMNVHIGQYVVFPPESFFRVSVSAGVGAIVTDVEGVPGREYTDVYLLVGDPTAEVTLGPVTLFVRPNLHYALGIGYNLLGTAWIRTPFGIPTFCAGARLSW